MKRSSSEIPSSPISSASDNDTKPDIASTPPKTKKAKSTPKTPTPRKRVQEEANGPSSGGGSGSGSGNGEWDSEKRGLMMDIIIAAGYKATDLESLANQLGVSKKQIINQLQPGRKGSLRDKAVQAVKG